MRSVSPILATDLKDLTVIGLFDFLGVNKTFLLEYNLVGQLQRALAQEVFVQEDAGLYEEQRAFQWYGERRDDHNGKSSDKTA